MTTEQAQQRAEQIVETHFSVNSDDLDWLRHRIAAALLDVQREAYREALFAEWQRKIKKMEREAKRKVK